MNTINIKRFAIAVGLTSVLLYVGCILVMVMAGREGTIFFFNSLLHGIDISSIVNMKPSLLVTLLGMIETFILGSLVGVSIAVIYNFSAKK
jgi:hypothetical protein